jgi:hypothetical protein
MLLSSRTAFTMSVMRLFWKMRVFLLRFSSQSRGTIRKTYFTSRSIACTSSTLTAATTP